MKYARQIQAALNDLDAKLLSLNRLIKNNKKTEAIQFMEQGPLKESYETLQNFINLSQNGNIGDNIGARGTTQTGAL